MDFDTFGGTFFLISSIVALVVLTPLMAYFEVKKENRSK